MVSEFKLKTASSLASLNLQPGDKVEVEVEGVDDAKVLLVNVNGKIHATGSKCTHYGAPLVKGVLTPSGQLICPWHGACFNTTTGDVEEAPALDGLSVFTVEERNGAIVVLAELEALKSGRRASGECSAAGRPAVSAERVVIIGGGSGAQGVLEVFHMKGYKGQVTVISSEGYRPIDRTKLSKALADDPTKLALRSQSWFASTAVNWVADEAVSVDFEARKVFTRANRDDGFQYDKLVLATGATPRRLKLPGFTDLTNIFTLRTADDTHQIKEAIAKPSASSPSDSSTPGRKNLVIVGSSFIGMELAVAMCGDNSVVVIGMEPTPLSRILGDQVGAGIQKLLEAKGVRFHMSASVQRAEASDADASAVGAVVLADGTRIPADLVVLGVGVVPATDFLRDNENVRLEHDGSVATNSHFRVPSHPEVYAIGDISTYPYTGPGSGGGTGRPTRIEHWNVAQNAGRSVATQIALGVAPPAFLPVFWSALGAQLRYCGNASKGWDHLILHGDPAAANFVAYYCCGDVVAAVASMGRDPLVARAAVLMKVDKMATRTQLEAGVDVLALPF